MEMSRQCSLNMILLIFILLLGAFKVTAFGAPPLQMGMQSQVAGLSQPWHGGVLSHVGHLDGLSDQRSSQPAQDGARI